MSPIWRQPGLCQDRREGYLLGELGKLLVETLREVKEQHGPLTCFLLILIVIQHLGVIRLAKTIHERDRQEIERVGQLNRELVDRVLPGMYSSERPGKAIEELEKLRKEAANGPR